MGYGPYLARRDGHNATGSEEAPARGILSALCLTSAILTDMVGLMREEDLIRLRRPYQQPVEPVPDDRRKDIEVGFGMEHVLDLGDIVADDLNVKDGDRT
jgi:hypothetical protein